MIMVHGAQIGRRANTPTNWARPSAGHRGNHPAMTTAYEPGAGNPPAWPRRRHQAQVASPALSRPPLASGTAAPPHRRTAAPAAGARPNPEDQRRPTRVITPAGSPTTKDPRPPAPNTDGLRPTHFRAGGTPRGHPSPQAHGRSPEVSPGPLPSPSRPTRAAAVQHEACRRGTRRQHRPTTTAPPPSTLPEHPAARTKPRTRA
jgi:hypothetical protein